MQAWVDCGYLEQGDGIMQPATQQAYAACGGVLCPFCGSAMIEGVDRVGVGMEGASQEVSCADCGKHWLDQYKLVGYVECKR